MRWPAPPVSANLPGFIEPCLPTISLNVPSGPGWAHELKHDGFRFICRRDGERVVAFRGSLSWRVYVFRRIWV
jgi:bifunctional non-homologous end joining protein LigD